MTIPLIGIYYLTMRLWIGLWAAFFCLIIVAVDGSAIVRYFTRLAYSLFRPNAKSYIVHVLDSRKKLSQLWSASSSSRSPCRSCSVSFIKLSTKIHLFINPQRWGRRSRCTWILTSTRSRPKSTAVVMPPTTLSLTSSTRCSSEYNQREEPLV